MEIRLLTEDEKEACAKEIYGLLLEADGDFVPPISARYPKAETDEQGNTVAVDGVRRYFEQMRERKLLVAFEDGALLGFVAFTENMTGAFIPKDSLPNIYIGTVIVCRAARGRRLTQGMYDHLFNTLYPHHSIFTRTWSTNIAHSTILSRMGFSELSRVKDERGVGIDTVYFALIRE